jgi:hypothetical protein
MGYPVEALAVSEEGRGSVQDFVCAICHGLADYSGVSYTACTHGAPRRPARVGKGLLLLFFPWASEWR